MKTKEQIINMIHSNKMVDIEIDDIFEDGDNRIAVEDVEQVKEQLHKLLVDVASEFESSTVLNYDIQFNECHNYFYFHRDTKLITVFDNLQALFDRCAKM